VKNVEPGMRLQQSVLVATAGLCLAACAANAATPNHPPPNKPDGSIIGTFRIQGGPYPGINRPLSGTIEIHVGSETGQVVATTTAKAGHFTVAVPAGRYVAVGRTGSGSSLLCTSGEAKAVHATKTVHLAVYCDVP
jgi:hypothetical protein